MPARYVLLPLPLVSALPFSPPLLPRGCDPAGHCLSDPLLRMIAPQQLSESGFPFCWETAAECRLLYETWCGGVMEPGECVAVHTPTRPDTWLASGDTWLVPPLIPTPDTWLASGDTWRTLPHPWLTPPVPRGRYVFRGEEFNLRADFPPKYWLRLCEDWAADYEHAASIACAGGDGGDPISRMAALTTALQAELAPLRTLRLPCIVLGSSADPVCDAAKMEAALTPALGEAARYVALPRKAKHTFFDDNGTNGSVYDLAGPELYRWILALMA